MLRTTNVFGQSRQMFQKPKDARKKHRDEKHVGHLEKFMETLEKQVYITKQEKGWRLRGRRSAHSAGTSRSQRTGCCEASHTETPIEEGDDGAESPAQDAADSNLSARPSQYSSSDDGGQDGCSTPCWDCIGRRERCTWSLLQATTLLGTTLVHDFWQWRSLSAEKLSWASCRRCGDCGWGLYQLLGGAACRESGEPHLTTSSHYIPQHFVAYLKTKRCIHPVMALHQAYIMAAQCDHPPPGDPADFALWFSHTCFQVSFNLCFDLPDCIDIVYLSETRPTFVRQDGLLFGESLYLWKGMRLALLSPLSCVREICVNGLTNLGHFELLKHGNIELSIIPHIRNTFPTMALRDSHHWPHIQDIDQFGDTHPETQEQTMDILS